MEKAHSTRLRQLEAELAEARTSAAQLARDLSAEQARRETLEAQQAELRRSLEAALAPAPTEKRARARASANPRKARTAKPAGAKPLSNTEGHDVDRRAPAPDIPVGSRSPA
jgi:septal ring factor EnvC (AmiA/AmiB activator)